MIYYVGESLLLTFLAINAYTDLKKNKIYLLTSLIYFFIGGVVFIFNNNYNLPSLIGGLALGVVLLIVGKVSAQAVGLGDGLIFLVTGVYLGFIRNLALLLYGLIICAVVSLFLLVFRKLKIKESIPFVPFVFIAFIIMVLLGV